MPDEALGIPTVASPITAYQQTLVDGRRCYFARTPEEWAERLLALGSAERRREMGLADREKIVAQYGLEAIGEKWLDLFTSLTGKKA